MAVIFDSVIKSNPVGRWYIEIRDTTEEDKIEVCLDIDEYAQKIEDMGAEYGGDIQVAWAAEENVSQEQINEVRMQMMAYEQKQNDQNQSGSYDHNLDGTPKF
ncbi:MAG: hypothetical protein K0U47_01090 [Epsilonproteobacteria bacterium]|nr:hypothetical protein [Campylobacterota bacterium]